MKKTLRAIVLLAVAGAAFLIGSAQAAAPPDPMMKTFLVVPTPQDGATVLTAKASQSVPGVEQAVVAGLTKMDGATNSAGMLAPQSDHVGLWQKPGVDSWGFGSGSISSYMVSLGAGGSSCVTSCRMQGGTLMPSIDFIKKI